MTLPIDHRRRTDIALLASWGGPFRTGRPFSGEIPVLFRPSPAAAQQSLTTFGGAAVFYTFAAGPEQVAKSKIERNLYYCRNVEESATPKFLQTLREQGVSASDVYADPMFVALKPGDFRLKPDSPALKMGIKQIDLRGVGLTKDFPKRLLE